MYLRLMIYALRETGQVSALSNREIVPICDMS